MSIALCKSLTPRLDVRSLCARLRRSISTLPRDRVSNPQKHHHVAQFMLDGWCGSDGRLAVHARKGGRLVIDRHTPEHTAYEMNLYTIEALPEGDRQWVEREVMSKAVDEPASKIHKRLLAGELAKLDSDGRTAWVRFMQAQWLRSPEEIAKVRQQGREILSRELDLRPHEFEVAKGDAPEPPAPSRSGGASMLSHAWCETAKTSAGREQLSVN